jgi:hypothetical protein
MTRIYLSYDTSDPENWTLDQPYQRDTAIGSVTVPKGFVTDLASTPRTLWSMLPRWGRWSGAAIVHDWFYRTRPEGLTRYRADRIFLKLMTDDGVRHGDATLIFKAVRQFGGTAWRKPADAKDKASG